MTQADFLESLEAELRLRHVAFDRLMLTEFVASVWPLIADDPDVRLWAGEFIASGNATVPA
jgi:hypothetical protein